jgi:hypothetical protein
MVVGLKKPTQMKKRKKIIDKTMNRRVYKQMKHIENGFGCIVCFKRSGGHNFGCGPWYPPREETRNWKYYRKTQWKEK